MKAYEAVQFSLRSSYNVEIVLLRVKFQNKKPLSDWHWHAILKEFVIQKPITKGLFVAFTCNPPDAGPVEKRDKEKTQSLEA